MPFKAQPPNRPDHVIVVAIRLLRSAWLSPDMRATVEHNVAKMRAKLEGKRLEAQDDGKS